MLNAIKSEILKIFTTRLWWGMAIGMGLLAFGISAGFAALIGLDTGGGAQEQAANPFAHLTVGTAQLIYNAGLVENMTTLFPLALGVLLITSEYRHMTISSTFLATPKRMVVLISKATAVTVIGALYAVVHAVMSVGGGVLVLATAKHEPLLLGEPQVWESLGIGILAFAIWMLLGFGFGMLVRNQVAAVLIAVGVAFVAHIALNIIFSVLHWTTAAKFLPGNLTTGMLVTSDPTGGASGTASPYFSWWVAALLLTGYAAVLAGTGTYLTAKRDIT